MHDSLPHSLCEECIINVNKLYNFRAIIINSDIELRNRLQALENVDPIKQNLNELEIKIEHDPIKIEMCDDVVEFVKTENDECEMYEQVPLETKLFSIQEGIDGCVKSETLPELPPVVENTPITCISSCGMAQENSVLGKTEMFLYFLTVDVTV